MALRLSKPNTRTFLSLTPGKPLYFGTNPANFITFTAVKQPESKNVIVVFEITAVGGKERKLSYLSVDPNGDLVASNEPYGFINVPLKSSQAFALGKSQVIIIDDTEWMAAHSSSNWKAIIFLIILLIVAGILAYLGRNNPRNDVSYLFFTD